MAKIATSPRITDKSAEWYREMFSSRNAGLEYILDAMPQIYRLTLHALRGRFSRGELMLILDAGNGTTLTAGIAGQHLAIGVADSIALDGLDSKWEVDKDALNNKIAGLTIFEAACLELWVQGFWRREVTDKKVEEYVREML